MAPINDAIADLDSRNPEERYTLKEVAEKWGVNRPTLGRRWMRMTTSRSDKNRQQQALSPQQELELINYITKLEFLLAFKTVFKRAFTSTNIQSAFSSNVRELKAQSTLLRERVRWHKSLSPALNIKAINQLKKGAEVIMLSAELMRDRITSLERANQAASARRQRKKRRIQKQGVLTKAAGEDLLAQREADQQIAREERQRGEQSGLSRQALARCTCCRETGYNSRTCKKDTLATT
ncbi:hypothetical protein HBH89_129340 [Parastagonospora nodorum]|nr:hypothetical protein HBH89_129340 [Parastagonospora nodorum]